MISLLPDSLCVHLPNASSETFGMVLVAVLSSAFLGGFAHCTFMCGPLVMMQTTARLENVPSSKMSEFTRLNAAFLAPYHAGRIMTYALLGVIVAYLGQALTSQWREAAAILVLFGAVGLMLSVLPLRIFGRFFKGCGTGKMMAGISGRLAGAFKAPMGLRGLLLGFVLGFLPCGMVYAALALAAATSDPMRGGLLMFAFGLATVPALVTVGLFGNIAATQFQRWITPLSRIATFAAGAWLMLMAIKMLTMQQHIYN